MNTLSLSLKDYILLEKEHHNESVLNDFQVRYLDTNYGKDLVVSRRHGHIHRDLSILGMW